MRATFVFLLVLLNSILASANPYSFVGSYLDEKNYTEFIQEQRQIEQSCGLIRSTYFSMYGESLYNCEVVSIKGRKFILAQGPYGDLSKAEVTWLKNRINMLSEKLKLNFIMGEYALSNNLVSKPNVMFEIEFLF